MKIELFPQDKINEFHAGVQWLLKVLQTEGALVTDESTLRDFTDMVEGSSPELRFYLSCQAGMHVTDDCYIWQIAQAWEMSQGRPASGGVH